MGERRPSRGPRLRTDQEIVANLEDIALLQAAAAGQFTVQPQLRMRLRHLAREDLLLAGFGTGVRVTLLPRGQRIISAGRGEIAARVED